MGHDIQRQPLAVKAAIDVSPQETAITERLSAWENMSLMAGLHGLASRSLLAHLLKLEVEGRATCSNERWTPTG